MCICDDDSYSMISLSIHPLICSLIIDMKINISIDTLCYSLPGKKCYNHSAVKIISSSIHHHYHSWSILPSIITIIIVNSIIITSSSIHHPSIHHLSSNLKLNKIVLSLLIITWTHNILNYYSYSYFYSKSNCMLLHPTIDPYKHIHIHTYTHSINIRIMELT